MSAEKAPSNPEETRFHCHEAKTEISDFNQFQPMPTNEAESTIAPDFCQLAPQYARDVGACLALRQYKMQDMTELSVTQFRAGSALTR